MNSKSIEVFQLFNTDYRDHVRNFCSQPLTRLPELLSNFWEKEIGESPGGVDWVAVSRQLVDSIERDAHRSY